MTAVTPGSAEQLRSAERLVTEFEDIFGDITATERKWLVEGIARLAAKPDEEGREQRSRLWNAARAVALHRPFAKQVCHVPTGLMYELLDALALSTTGEPKRSARPPKTPMPWIDAEEGDMS